MGILPGQIVGYHEEAILVGWSTRHEGMGVTFPPYWVNFERSRQIHRGYSVVSALALYQIGFSIWILAHWLAYVLIIHTRYKEGY